jgi:hypothetical protein
VVAAPQSSSFSRFGRLYALLVRKARFVMMLGLVRFR